MAAQFIPEIVTEFEILTFKRIIHPNFSCTLWVTPRHAF